MPQLNLTEIVKEVELEAKAWATALDLESTSSVNIFRVTNYYVKSCPYIIDYTIKNN